MVRTVKRVKLRHCVNFCRNRSNGGRDNGDFSIIPRWRPSANLDLWRVYWDHPRRAFGVFYHCANFGLNPYSSFDNLHVIRFREFGLKTPRLFSIHVPNVFWGVDSLNGEACEQIPKGYILARVRVV